MKIACSKNDASQTATLQIPSRFDFGLVKAFRESYLDLSGWQIIIDLRDTDYMDSAGLGMLLNMKKYLAIPDRQIRITNCRPQIKKIMLISRFDHKFIVE